VHVIIINSKLEKNPFVFKRLILKKF